MANSTGMDRIRAKLPDRYEKAFIYRLDHDAVLLLDAIGDDSREVVMGNLRVHVTGLAERFGYKHFVVVPRLGVPTGFYLRGIVEGIARRPSAPQRGRRGYVK